MRVQCCVSSQATVKMEGGKIVFEFPNYRQTSEIVGDKLVEVSILQGSGTVSRTPSAQAQPPEVGLGQPALPSHQGAFDLL